MKFKLSAINCTAAISLALAVSAEAHNYFVFVSNERSGDVNVIDGATDAVVATFKVGKRPRGIHATPDGQASVCDVERFASRHPALTKIARPRTRALMGSA